ncbi:hypothetical protein OFQ61_09620 [Brachyspira hyodysenteriae]|nr:hypothetical protein [Brachyspira hyodysenteriae]MCZ9967352.1 hypothetical protein [Brachyspira hyodysenteriae]
MENHLASINSKIDNEIYNVSSKLDSEISDLKNKYDALNVDFEETLDLIKSSILDRDELIELHNSEKELLANRIYELKEEFDNFKKEALNANKEDIPALFEEEKQRIENAFEEFTNNLN